jgi:hypothetical protein
MNPLASRKKLLIAESELNRAQLVQDWQTLTAEVSGLAKEARTLRAIASATAGLVTGLISLRRKHRMPASAKPSWLQTLLKGAGQISTVWAAFRAPARPSRDE